MDGSDSCFFFLATDDDTLETGWGQDKCARRTPLPLPPLARENDHFALRVTHANMFPIVGPAETPPPFHRAACTSGSAQGK